MDKEKKEEIALFRFGVISGLLWVKEEERQSRKAGLREITSRVWEIPFSNRTVLGCSTVLEWLKKYRDSGGRIESLEPQQRSDKGKARSLDEETEQSLVGLKTELKGASLPVILRVARERKLLPPDFHASIQSLYRLFQRLGLNEPQGLKPDLRRYETELPNDLWQSDCMHGPSVIVDGKVRKSFLFAFLDDHSRLIPHGEFYLQENLKNLTDCLIKALSKKGLPRKIYLDNGPSFRSHQLAHTTASLGISLIHCTPYRPGGKGKIVRYFKTLRMQFLALLSPSLSLSALNQRFEQWCDQTYHRTVHGTTKETPWDRYTQHLHNYNTQLRVVNTIALFLSKMGLKTEPIKYYKKKQETKGEDKMRKIHEIYLINQPFIKTLARRYSKIDHAVSYEDLLSEGYIAVANALKSFKPQSNLTFSSYLWWHLQKRFQSALGTDKIVEVKYSDGKEGVLPYREFLRIKRSLPEGTTWKVASLLSSLEELSGEKGELW